MMIGIAAMPYTTPAASVRNVRGTGASPPARNTSARTAAEVGLNSPQRRRNSTRVWVMSRELIGKFSAHSRASGNPENERKRASIAPAALMHTRPFEELGAVAGFDRHL